MFSNFLNETKGFKYQIRLKYKPNGKTEFASVYFNSTTKQWQIINLVLKMFFKNICTGLITGLMKDLAGLLSWSSLNTLTF